MIDLTLANKLRDVFSGNLRFRTVNVKRKARDVNMRSVDDARQVRKKTIDLRTDCCRRRIPLSAMPKEEPCRSHQLHRLERPVA